MEKLIEARSTTCSGRKCVYDIATNSSNLFSLLMYLFESAINDLPFYILVGTTHLMQTMLVLAVFLATITLGQGIVEILLVVVREIQWLLCLNYGTIAEIDTMATRRVQAGRYVDFEVLRSLGIPTNMLRRMKSQYGRSDRRQLFITLVYKYLRKGASKMLKFAAFQAVTRAEARVSGMVDKTIDLVLEPLEAMLTKIQDASGYRITTHHLILFITNLGLICNHPTAQVLATIIASTATDLQGASASIRAFEVSVYVFLYRRYSPTAEVTGQSDTEAMVGIVGHLVAEQNQARFEGVVDGMKKFDLTTIAKFSASVLAIARLVAFIRDCARSYGYMMTESTVVLKSILHLRDQHPTTLSPRLFAQWYPRFQKLTEQVVDGGATPVVNMALYVEARAYMETQKAALAAAPTHRRPYAFYIGGSSAIGKSTMAPALFKFIVDHINTVDPGFMRPFEPTEIYSIPNASYWSGYRGQQCLLCDDIQSTYWTNGDNHASDFMAYMGGKNVQLNMAHLSDKGAVYSDIRSVLWLHNNASLTIPGVSQAAIESRFIRNYWLERKTRVPVSRDYSHVTFYRTVSTPNGVEYSRLDGYGAFLRDIQLAIEEHAQREPPSIDGMIEDMMQAMRQPVAVEERGVAQPEQVVVQPEHLEPLENFGLDHIVPIPMDEFVPHIHDDIPVDEAELDARFLRELEINPEQQRIRDNGAVDDYVEGHMQADDGDTAPLNVETLHTHEYGYPHARARDTGTSNWREWKYVRVMFGAPLRADCYPERWITFATAIDGNPIFQRELLESFARICRHQSVHFDNFDPLAHPDLVPHILRLKNECVVESFWCGFGGMLAIEVFLISTLKLVTYFGTPVTPEVAEELTGMSAGHRHRVVKEKATYKKPVMVDKETTGLMEYTTMLGEIEVVTAATRYSQGLWYPGDNVAVLTRHAHNSILELHDATLHVKRDDEVVTMSLDQFRGSAVLELEGDMVAVRLTLLKAHPSTRHAKMYTNNDMEEGQATLVTRHAHETVAVQVVGPVSYPAGTENRVYTHERMYQYTSRLVTPGSCGSLLVQRGKIVGYHVAGNANTGVGYAMHITDNLVVRLMTPDGYVKGAVREYVDIVAVLKENDVNVVRRTSSPLIHGTTVLVPNQRMLDALRITPSKVPAKLGWITEETGSGLQVSHPLIDHALVIGSRRPHLERDLTPEERYVCETLAEQLAVLGGECFEATTSEVISGSERVDALDPTKSAGSVSRGPSRVPKSRHISSGQLIYLGPVVEEYYNRLASEPFEDIAPQEDRMFVARLKDETRRPGKAARAFFIPALAQYFMSRRALSWLQSFVMKNPVKSGLGVGTVPNRDHWQQLYNKLGGDGARVFEMDYSGFDQSVSVVARRALRHVILTLGQQLGASADHIMRMQNIIPDAELVEFGPALVEVRGPLMSGIYPTTVFGGIVNLFVMAMAYVHRGCDPRSAVTHFLATQPQTYSDDFISRVPSAISVQDIADKVEVYGMHVTSPQDKTQPPIVGDIQSSSYLKRSFKVINGHVYAPLDKESIEGMVCYRSKTMYESDYYRAVRMQIELEAAAHGEDYYTMWTGRLAKLASEFKLTYEPLGWQEALEKLRDGPEYVQYLWCSRGVEGQMLASALSAAMPFMLLTGFNTAMSVLHTRGTRGRPIAPPPASHIQHMARDLDVMHAAHHNRRIAAIASEHDQKVFKQQLEARDGMPHRAETPEEVQNGESRPFGALPPPPYFASGTTTSENYVDAPDLSRPMSSFTGSNVYGGSTLEWTPDIATMARRHAYIRVCPWSTSTIRGGPIENSRITPTPCLVLMDINATSTTEVTFPPAASVTMPFASWRSPAAVLRVTIVAPVFVTGSLRVVYAPNADIPDTFNPYNFDVSPTVPQFAVIDVSEVREADIILPYMNFSPTMAVTPVIDGEAWSEDLSRLTFGTVKLFVEQPLTNPGGVELTVGVLLSLAYSDLQVYSVSKSALSTFYGFAGQMQADNDATPSEAVISYKLPEALATRHKSTYIPGHIHVGSVLERSIVMYCGEWSSSLSLQYDVPHILVTNVSMQRHMAYNQQLVTDIGVTVRVTSGPAVGALGILYAIPYGPMYKTPGDIAMQKLRANITRKMIFPHVLVFGGSNGSYELVLPHLSMVGAFPLSGERLQWLREMTGYTVFFDSVISPMGTTTATPPVTVVFEVRMINPQLSVPTTSEVVGLMETVDSTPVGGQITNTGAEIKERIADKAGLEAVYYGDEFTHILQLYRLRHYQLVSAPSVDFPARGTTQTFLVVKLTIPKFYSPLADANPVLWWCNSMWTTIRGSVVCTRSRGVYSVVQTTPYGALTMNPSMDITEYYPERALQVAESAYYPDAIICNANIVTASSVQTVMRSPVPNSIFSRVEDLAPVRIPGDSVLPHDFLLLPYYSEYGAAVQRRIQQSRLTYTTFYLGPTNSAFAGAGTVQTTVPHIVGWSLGDDGEVSIPRPIVGVYALVASIRTRMSLAAREMYYDFSLAAP